MGKSKVYFTRAITPENMVKMYEILGKKLEGKVDVKLQAVKWETRIFFGQSS